MLEPRVMPCLLLSNGALVKTHKFERPGYVGDPINAVRIFNELETDELVLLDIAAARSRSAPDFELLEQIASECFMPLTYGGGISSVAHIRMLHRIGIEKTVINTAALERPQLLDEAATTFGSQSVVVAIDCRKRLTGGYVVCSHGGTRKTRRAPDEWAAEAVQRGAGELFLTSIDKEGTWSGYDLALLKLVTSISSVPVIAHGGASRIADFVTAISDGGASAVAVGNMTVYQKKGAGVLINFPTRAELRPVLELRPAGISFSDPNKPR